jgi:uncharacterized membrane protein
LAWLGLACALVSSSFSLFLILFFSNSYKKKNAITSIGTSSSLSIVIKQYFVIKYKMKELEQNKA